MELSRKIAYKRQSQKIIWLRETISNMTRSGSEMVHVGRLCIRDRKRYNHKGF